MLHHEQDRPAILGGRAILDSGPPPWPLADPEVRRALEQAFESGDWGRYHGRSVEQLKQALSAFLQVPHVELYCSGTAAVEIALRAIPVRPGDEVILCAYDFRGNFHDVLAVGAVPVLVDAAASRWTIDIDQVRSAVTEKTRAILVSHLHGDLLDMQRLRQVADDLGLPVLEDACQVPGAIVSGRAAGCWGDVGVFSFGGSKLLTAGRGGALFTARDDILQRARLDQQRGNEVSPLSELQAAALIPQLALLNERNQLRQERVNQLRNELHGVEAVRIVDAPVDGLSAFYKVGLIYEADCVAGLNASSFCRAVRAEGVALDPGFRSLHLTHSRRRFRAVGDLTQASRLDQCSLVLHHPVLLESASTIARVAAAIRRVVTNGHAIQQAMSGEE